MIWFLDLELRSVPLSMILITTKEKWRVFSRVWEFIHFFDKDYKPLGNPKIEPDKINKPMIKFPEIMETMNEKK